MEINPTKCVFRVNFDKFLGYVITQHGIEMNLKKVQAILDLER